MVGDYKGTNSKTATTEDVALIEVEEPNCGGKFGYYHLVPMQRNRLMAESMHLRVEGFGEQARRVTDNRISGDKISFEENVKVFGQDVDGTIFHNGSTTRGSSGGPLSVNDISFLVAVALVQGRDGSEWRPSDSCGPKEKILSCDHAIPVSVLFRNHPDFIDKIKSDKNANDHLMLVRPR